jgi:hypothetical protein
VTTTGFHRGCGFDERGWRSENDRCAKRKGRAVNKKRWFLCRERCVDNWKERFSYLRRRSTIENEARTIGDNALSTSREPSPTRFDALQIVKNARQTREQSFQ